jgi:hypothetical protein
MRIPSSRLRVSDVTLAFWDPISSDAWAVPWSARISFSWM